MAKTQSEKKDKKALLALLLLLLAFAIIIASALAFFSDTISGTIGATAGTLDIDLTTFEGKQYWTSGGALTTTPNEFDFNEEETIDNLNPGDAIVIDFGIENLGNKSAYIRAIIGDMKVELNPVVEENMETAIEEIDDRLAQITIALLTATGDEKTALEDERDAITTEKETIRDQIDNPEKLLKLYAVKSEQTLSTADIKTLIDEGGISSLESVLELAENSSTIINGGSGNNDEEETLGEDGPLDLEYVLYFDKLAINVLQNAKVDFKMKVQAMQYRNNSDLEWDDVTSIPFSLSDTTTP